MSQTRTATTSTFCLTISLGLPILLVLAALILSSCSSSQDRTATTESVTDSHASNLNGTCSPQQFAELIKQPDTVVIDVRTPEEYSQRHIPDAVLMNIHDSEFVSQIQKLDPQKNYAIYCRSGKRSKAALEQFKAAGLNACDLAGGINAWSAETEN